MPEAEIHLIPTTESERTGMGAVLKGVDAAGPLAPATVAAIRKAALAYPVLILPGQKLTAEGLIAFARNLGDIQPHTAERYWHPEHPELSYVSNVDREGRIDTFGHERRATGWHSDGSFLGTPYSFTMLYALEVPKVGGPTLFANMTKAYRHLPPELRRRADEAVAVHALASGPDGESAPSANKRRETPDAFPEIERPVVQVHPETGEKSIFLNPTHTSHIIGDDRNAPNSLYASLITFATSPDFVYRHNWTVGDLVIWDQRCTMHRAGGGVGVNERRVMLRALIAGVQQAA